MCSLPVAGGLISARDFVEVEIEHTFEDGRRISFFKSVELIDKKFQLPNPPPKEGSVRGELSVSSITVKPNGEDSIELCYLVSGDPKGLIPSINKLHRSIDTLEGDFGKELTV